MAYYYANWISIGTHADMDSEANPANPTLTNPGVLIGETFSNADANTGNDMSIESVRLNDANSDGSIYDGDGNYEHVTVNGTTSNVDSYSQWNATVVLEGGTVVTQIVHVIQLQDGRTYVSQVNNLDNLEINSITLDSIYTDNFTHFSVSNPASFTSVENTTFVCFTRGTVIETDTGAERVEDLAQGDMVLTADHGHQSIRWIGSQRLEADALRKNEKLRPVRIGAGALGNNTPESDLLVSPQHRILVTSKIANRMFGKNEVLVAAKQLLALDSIDIADDIEAVEYFHFLFDRHEVIFSNGAATESLFTGPQALKSLNPASKEEILTIFPELSDIDYKSRPARPLAHGRKGRQLVHRHIINQRPLTSGIALH